MRDAELVERLPHAVVDEVVDGLWKDVEAGHRRQDRRAVEGELVHRLEVAGMERVSRTMSTSGRRSFRWTSAARTMRLSFSECAIALIVRMLHGATSIPAVTNVPLARAAARSFSSYRTCARASTSATFRSVSYSIVA